MKNTFVLAALVALVVLAGCGGGGGSNPGPPPDPSWAGHYVGDWKALAIGHFGDADVVVQTDGKLNGTVFDSTAGENGTITGRITGDGKFNGSVAFDSGVSSLKGDFWQTATGMDGLLVQTQGGESFEVEFELDKQ